jgi:hypothetical protein
MQAISINNTDMQKGSKLHLNLTKFITVMMGTFRFAVILWKTTSNYKITGRHMCYMSLEVGGPE